MAVDVNDLFNKVVDVNLVRLINSIAIYSDGKITINFNCNIEINERKSEQIEEGVYGLWFRNIDAAENGSYSSNMYLPIGTRKVVAVGFSQL